MILASLLEFTWLSDPQAWGALFTLTVLEIVLGIDNIVFISILVDRLPEEQRKQGRLIGLSLAMGARMALLLSITWIMSMQNPLFHVPILPALWDIMPSVKAHGGSLGVSVKDLILLGGGFFLIWKSTKEILHTLADAEDATPNRGTKSSFGSVLIQIAMIDIIFSLDSVITAVGMVNDPSRVSLMMVAVILAIGVMMVASGAIGAFVSKHPSVKMLALSFLIMIGVVLMGEALHFHVPKGYLYFAMGFSLAVELLNLRLRSRRAAALAAATGGV
jgi:predicted tellurium resistance membrane protein TerC